jgi:hypothetical protein
VGVVDRVHRTTSLVWLATHPAFPSRLAKYDVLVFGIADDTEGCIALSVYTSNLARWQTNGHIIAIASLNLCARSRTSSQLRPFSGHQFNIVYYRTYGDKAQWHRIAHKRLHFVDSDVCDRPHETVK